MQGHTIMEVTVLLLLAISLTTATPMRQTQRTQKDSLSLLRSRQRSKGMTLFGINRKSLSVDTKTPDKPDPDAASSLLIQTILKKARDTTHSRLRRRRAAPRGCQLGTCQVHNLANKLYRIGQSNGKDESKKANDPQGYGR